MNLMLAGLSHKTASVEVRERFAISERRIPEALEKLRAEPEIQEALILSTCNRVEFVVKVREDCDGVEALRRFAGSFYGLEYNEYAPFFYVYYDYEAVRHLFRVASGLDSMVVGEPQVLGQAKKAYALAKEAQTTGSLLDAVFPQAFNVAKRVRTETPVAEAAVSVSSAAVELAERVFGELRGRTVMIIGAGQMGELAARHLVTKGAATDSILSFAEKHAVDLIVMGTHGRQGFDHLLLGSVTEKVLRKARCPVLAVRKPSHNFVAPENGADPVHLRKILFATDFSRHAERALDYALSLAQEYEAELTLLHVLEEIPPSWDLSTATADVVSRLEKPIPAEARSWCTLKSRLRVGRPYQEIVRFALETETDLVILGVRGRNALDLALFGSTTHRVIHQAPCPVLAVHI